MGAGQSRQGGGDDDLYIESGVRVTQGLLEQLDGKRRPQRQPAAAGGGSATQQALRPRSEEALGEAAAAAAGDRSLARALERSRRVGGALLKAEKEELGRVESFAEELLAKSYAAPSRPRPCGQEAEDCVRCYAEHAGDTLACAAAVDAYSGCARAAWREAMARGAGV